MEIKLTINLDNLTSKLKEYDTSYDIEFRHSTIIANYKNLPSIINEIMSKVLKNSKYQYIGYKKIELLDTIKYILSDNTVVAVELLPDECYDETTGRWTAR